MKLSEFQNEFNKPYFIADIGANHDGSIERAYKLIELAKESGADAAKFQNFKANKIVSKNGFDSMKKTSHQSKWKKSVFEVYNDASIPDDWSRLLKRKCDEVGIEYFTSPYDFDSVDLADKYSRFFKIGSGDITWIEIIRYISKKKKPVLIATGASTFSDVKRAINEIKKHNNMIVLMQCNTNYTDTDENFQHLNLKVLETYRKHFPDILLGLSDHTKGHTSVLGAIALGATVIEKHFTDDNNRVGPDHKFAMNPTTWKEMVKESNKLFSSLGDGVKRIQDNEIESSIIQRRALYLRNNLKRNQILKESDIIPLRPIKKGGLNPYEKSKIIGKKINKDCNEGKMLLLEDFND